ncbi:MAG: DUF222 domain-containing protein [Actinomycetota bacterium]|nr:DUF222 domain-containing protein [Actinomycetota bacterium]
MPEVSEWAVDEVAPTLRISGPAATAQLADAVVLAERLLLTLGLLSRGELSPAHAGQMVHIVGPVTDDGLRADIEAHVLGLLGDKTPPQLGDCARKIVLRRDAEAAGRRLVAAVRERGVRLHDRRDGTGTVAIELLLPVCAAIYRALEAHAEQVRAEGDERIKQQRMADVLADLVLRPGEHGLPPVTIALTLVATLETMLGGAEPGQVEGHLVPAQMVRELAYTFGLLPRPAPDLDGLDGRPGGSPTVTDRSDPDPAQYPAQYLAPSPAPAAPLASPPSPAPTHDSARQPAEPTPGPGPGAAEPASPPGPEPASLPGAGPGATPWPTGRCRSGWRWPQPGTRPRCGRGWPGRRRRCATACGPTGSCAPCWTWAR